MISGFLSVDAVKCVYLISVHASVVCAQKGDVQKTRPFFLICDSFIYWRHVIVYTGITRQKQRRKSIVIMLEFGDNF